MRNITLLISVVIFSLFAFVAGMYYGFKEGITNLGLLEEVAQGALSRHQLASIEKDQIDSVIHLFELNIDAGLHRYVVFKESGNMILSNHFMPEVVGELEGYVDLMVDYRKDQPIIINSNWTLPIEGDTDEVKEWKKQGFEESEKMLKELKKLLRERGVPESALTSSSN